MNAAVGMDTYRLAIATCTAAYRISDKAPKSVGAIREQALAVVLNLASGLGFWDNVPWSVKHFTAALDALDKMIPLMELAQAVGVDMGNEDEHLIVRVVELRHHVKRLKKEAEKRRS